MYFRLKYYSLDHIYALYIQISHMVAFAAPPPKKKTMNLQHSKLPYLPTRSFVSWRYMLAVIGSRTLV